MSGSFQARFRSSLSRLDASDSWYDNRQPRADHGQRVRGNRVRYNDFVHQRHNAKSMMQSSVSLRSSLRSAEGIGNRMSNSASGFNNAREHSNNDWFINKNDDNNGDNSIKTSKRGSNTPSEGYFCYGWKTSGPLSSRSKPKPYLGWRRSLGNLDETDYTRNNNHNGSNNNKGSNNGNNVGNMNGNNHDNHKMFTPAERLASSRIVADNSAKELREVSNVIVDYFANKKDESLSKTNNRNMNRRVWLESSFLSSKT